MGLGTGNWQEESELGLGKGVWCQGWVTAPESCGVGDSAVSKPGVPGEPLSPHSVPRAGLALGLPREQSPWRAGTGTEPSGTG